MCTGVIVVGACVPENLLDSRKTVHELHELSRKYILSRALQIHIDRSQANSTQIFLKTELSLTYVQGFEKLWIGQFKKT